MKALLNVLFLVIAVVGFTGCSTVERTNSTDAGVVHFFGCSWPAPQNTVNLINRTPYVLEVKTTGVLCARYVIPPMGSHDINLNCFSGNNGGGSQLSVSIMAYSNGQYVGGEDRIFPIFSDGNFHCQNWSFDGRNCQNPFRSQQSGW